MQIRYPTLRHRVRERPAISIGEAERRRTTRIARIAPLTVIGEDLRGEPFRESTSTLSFNCHGCRYQSRHYVSENSWMMLEIPHPEGWCEPHNVHARVVRVCPSDAADERHHQISVELAISGNIWEMAFPPKDWFAFAKGSALAVRPSPSFLEDALAAYSKRLQAALDDIGRQIIARLPVELERELSSLFETPATVRRIDE